MIKIYDIFLFLQGDLRLRPDYYAILGQISMHELERKERFAIKPEYLESIISMKYSDVFNRKLIALSLSI
ncbi:MAG: hypothetical protein Q8L97_11455 [Nitrosomonas sp.]|uniref:hypothetical protein n=1 Tax=Nitrosomonas sp. TaxID=42353 RepID=UPI002731EF76|nr:hypothetical protein [Nitrosomonas sp.]MDP1550751.1 hypothetical protein [Nitrosomonas sp.]